MGTRSPSKYMALALLEQIRVDHYLGADGTDYEASEVDDLIIQKQERTVFNPCDAVEKERSRLLARIKLFRRAIRGLPERLALEVVETLRSDVCAIARVINH